MGRGGVRGMGVAFDVEDGVVVVREGCTYQSFKRCDPPKLTGLGDASTVLQWIITMDRVIRVSNCRPDQAVGYVSQCLTDEALYWWENVELTRTEADLAALRWVDMKEMIRGRFLCRV